MTKKEQAELAELRTELALARAFRWTEPVERDVPPPEHGIWGALSRGYDFNVSLGIFGGVRVEKACSSSTSNGSGWEKATSQRPRRLFSTRLLALKAARYEAERQTADTLARIDKEIEKAKLSPTEEIPDA